MTRLVALLLTVLTGFSGLTYQVAWQKYLATLLGSDSEATAAVLGIFLGGLSAGYMLFGRVTLALSRRAAARGATPPLLIVYGLLEAGIGVYALIFPAFFRGVQALSLALPHGVGGVGFAVDVALSALLIGPATVLMGGTIPILTQALSRSLEDATRFHALVYAFNTAGAFVGALAAGFVLVPQLGLVRVMIAMGAVNLFAGALFVAIGRRRPGAALSRGPESRRVESPRTYRAVALLVGFAMMVIQTVVIRVAALSFGPSQFSFSMVVAIFVFCIALGSFVVSAFPNVRARHVLGNQWALALLVLLLHFALPRTPFWAYVLRSGFADTPVAFGLFQSQVFLLLGLICGPAIVCSGATLPLLFHQLRREVGDLGHSAGSLYGWNTVGSLLGALLGGYALLFWLDLHEVFALALAALLLAALLLTTRVYAAGRIPALALAGVLLAVGLLAPWDPRLLSLGLFRERAAPGEAIPDMHAYLASHRDYGLPLLYYEDDPTLTASVRSAEFGGATSLIIATNGKVDGNSVQDYTTMAMAGVVPAMFADDPRQAFVIGWGTGVTAGELAALDSIERVVVSEISTGVMHAAPLFESANQGALSSPKVEVVRSDAYRALMRSQGRFDVIASEPSNPWVAGVENLYSHEFLTAVRERMRPGGVFGQWFHVYEIDRATVELALRTYTEVFGHVAVWYMLPSDLLLLAFENPTAARDHFRLEQRAGLPDVRAALERAGVRSFPALLAHELLPLGVLHELDLGDTIQSLYHPRLGYLAGRAFFMRQPAELPFSGGGRAAELGARNSLLSLYASRFGGSLPDAARDAVLRETCKHRPELCATLVARWKLDDPDSPALARALADGVAAVAAPGTLDDLMRFFDADRGATNGAAAPDPRRAEALTQTYRTHYHHAAPFDGDALVDVWERCRVAPPTLDQCREAEARQRSALVLDAESRRERIERCASTPRVDPGCQRGLSRARMLVDGER